jgi:hypothetical protein
MLETNKIAGSEGIVFPPLPHGKTATEVSTDYLLKLRQAIRFALHAELGDAFLEEERRIYWCFTVPSMVDEIGKRAFRDVIYDAGFLRDADDQRLLFISEPMASILSVSATSSLPLKRLETLLIVNCGHTMIDLMAFEVKEETPLSVKELTAASADFCG